MPWVGNSPRSSQAEIVAKLRAVQYALAEKRLRDFVRAAWDVLEPRTELKWNWHHDLICEHLEAVRDGQIRRLIVNVPPRELKSTIVTVCFPAWVWLKEPQERFLFGSYADSLARKHSILRRALIESPWFQRSWGDRFRLRDDLNTKSDFGNDKMGQMKAAGISGSVTGEGGNYLIFDDPHNPKKVESDVERQSTLDNLDLAWMSRLNDRTIGRVVLVMQRTHDADATQHFLDTGEYTHLKLPAVEDEPKRTLVFPVSGKTIERKEGEELHPARLDAKVRAQLEKDLGSWGYAAQYQQNPVPRKGGMVQLSWFKSYTVQPSKFDRVIMSWDMAFKDTKASAYVVGQVWGKIEGRAYLIDQVREKMDFVASCHAVAALIAKHPRATRRLVEDKANGPAIIAQLKSKFPGLIAVQTADDKVARFAAVTPFFESGNIYVPDESIAPWVNDYKLELTRFPRTTYKDQVDATSQALIDLFDPKGDTLSKMVVL